MCLLFSAAAVSPPKSNLASRTEMQRPKRLLAKCGTYAAARGANRWGDNAVICAISPLHTGGQLSPVGEGGSVFLHLENAQILLASVLSLKQKDKKRGFRAMRLVTLPSCERARMFGIAYSRDSPVLV